MNATMIKQNAEGIRLSHREREEKNGLARGYKAVYMDAGKLVDLVDLRIAFTSSGTPYACVWCYQPGEFAKNGMGGCWNSGSGTAGGYGYHKGSAAVESAFRAAGIKFNSEVCGCGWERVKDAVQAAGEMLIELQNSALLRSEKHHLRCLLICSSGSPPFHLRPVRGRASFIALKG